MFGPPAKLDRRGQKTCQRVRTNTEGQTQPSGRGRIVSSWSASGQPLVSLLVSLWSHSDTSQFIINAYTCTSEDIRIWPSGKC